MESSKRIKPISTLALILMPLSIVAEQGAVAGNDLGEVRDVPGSSKKVTGVVHLLMAVAIGGFSVLRKSVVSQIK